MKILKRNFQNRTLDQNLKRIVVFLSLVFILSGCGSKKSEEAPAPADQDFAVKQVVGIGRIEPELKILDLTSEVSGIIRTIFIQPGDTISRGQMIIGLIDDVEKARVEQAAARVQAQAAQIDAAKALLAATQIRAANAKTNFDRAKNLFEQSAETRSNYDNAKADYESHLQDVTRLEADVIVAQKVLKQSQADLRLAQAELEQKAIIAPSDGQLLSLDITIGSFISSGKAIGTFAPKSSLTAWCEIDELFAPKVQLHQKAYIRPQGMTDTLAVGTVSFVGPSLRKKTIFSDDVGSLEDRRVREVRIRLEPGARLLFGSRVECVILIE
jgi:multidrug efflux pump subunit AcrA (membrane-fusion protein)